MKFKIAYFLIFSSLFFYGQEAAFFDKLHSTEIEKSVYLLFDGKTFSYSKQWSEEDKSFNTIKKNEVKHFQISNDDNNNFKLYLAFYNPLQVKIENSVTEEDDSNYTAISTFLESLPTDIPFSGGADESDGTKSYSKSDITNYKGLDIVSKSLVDKNFKLVNVAISNLPENSMLLYDWVKIINKNVDITRICKDNLYTKSFLKEAETISGVKAIEGFLFKPIEITISRGNQQLKTVNEWIKFSHDLLYNADQNFEVFSSKLELSKIIYEKLVTQRDLAQVNLKALTDMLSNDLATIETLLELDKNEKIDFRNLTKSKVIFIEAMILDRLESLNKNLSTFSKLNKKLEDFKAKFTSSKGPIGYTLIVEDSFPWEYEKTKVFDIKSTKLLQNGDAATDGIYSIKVKVFKSQGRLAVFPSLGLFYTPFEYKNFGISDGTVAETQGDAVYFRPAVYLNFLLRPKKGDILYPMLQIGITQGVKTPLFPIGFGFSIRDKFSITAGPLIAFQNELETLSVGSLADDAMLKDDLDTRVRLSWYLSLNYKLGK
ncbi:hypothetical protein [uncultured Winogradskyella sp.]|uniref:hypothetical protein n=1 Tax=uncultured Winogradskyella sp. TaxID=395353 RepID=UPI0030EC5474|tara:strand:+ start:85 stop:1716 length:1632 start_codon:yes stop_codon:yes gene_type:complete